MRHVNDMRLVISFRLEESVLFVAKNLINEDSAEERAGADT
jgi:hypothetical protein